MATGDEIFLNALNQAFANRQRGNATAAAREASANSLAASIDARRAQQAQQEAHNAILNRQLDLQDAARYTDLSPYASQFGLEGDVSRVPTHIVPSIMQQSGKTREDAARSAEGESLAKVIERRGTTPGRLTDTPEAGTDPEAMAFAERTPNVVSPAAQESAQWVRALMGKNAAAAAAAKELISPKPIALGRDQRLVQGGEEVIPAGTPKPKIERIQGRDGFYHVTTDPETGAMIGDPTKIPDIEPPGSRAVYTREDIDKQIQLEQKLAGLKPGTQEHATTAAQLATAQRYNDLARFTMLPPGGGVVGAGSGFPPDTPVKLGPAAGIPGAPSGPGAVPGNYPPTGPRLLTERAPSAVEATHYVNKVTLQPPPTGMTLTEIQQSGQYQQVPTGSIPAIKQLNTVKSMLDEAEKVIESRPDLFPPSVKSLVMDNIKVAKSASLYLAGKKTDADIGNLEALKVALPTTVKAFGDTGNVAVKEREITDAALGLSPSTKEAAMARINTIRRLVNASAATAGFPSLVGRQGAAAPAAAGPSTLSRGDKLYKDAKAKGFSDDHISQSFGVGLTD